LWRILSVMFIYRPKNAAEFANKELEFHFTKITHMFHRKVAISKT